MYLGIDVGTSGVRCCILDHQGRSIGQSQAAFPTLPGREGQRHQQPPSMWWDTLKQAIGALSQQQRDTCSHLAVDATSGSMVALDQHFIPVADALMYDDQRAMREALIVEKHAPINSPALGATSGLAKMLWLLARHPETRHFRHQSDWLTGKLLGKHLFSDENNALKSGYDLTHRQWPEWLSALGIKPASLPQVVEPGSLLGEIDPEQAQALGLPESLTVHAGTTDSIAAFLASPAQQPGDAVTSLGSSLVIKLLSDRPISSPEHGIYSHRVGPWWLVGGASNTGGAVLLQHFNAAQLESLSLQLPIDRPDPHYYPLPDKGERFPIVDAQMESRISPRPANDAEFLQGLLQGISNIESNAYRCLNTLGAPSPRRIFSSGGGAKNAAWLSYRQQRLPCKIHTLQHNEPACGAARLARGPIRPD